MWSQPFRNAVSTVTTRFWSPAGLLSTGRMPGDTTSSFSSMNSRSFGTSRPEEITPSQPDSRHCLARDSTSSSISQSKPRSSRSPRSRLVRTVTPRTFRLPPLFAAAASMIERLPCTVTNVAPRSLSERTAEPTVAGMSKNLRSQKTFFSRASIQSSNSKYSPLIISSSPIL